MRAEAILSRQHRTTFPALPSFWHKATNRNQTLGPKAEETRMEGGNWKEMFNAACEGNLELVRYHVENGVDVNYAHPEFLSTPLVAAALAGQESVALYLLESGADPDLPSEFDAMKPLQAARKAGLAALEARLTELGAKEPPVPELKFNQSWLSRLLARSATLYLSTDRKEK